ncbi:MAG: tetratricopeptide repeat protein, partial [Candidatus Omnitrophica bacterium]|nr:tetratricopeptide repeat protein [Candidatus Omnitrophota bacterium]
GGECGVCGYWVAAGDSHYCWEGSSAQSEGSSEPWIWRPGGGGASAPAGPSPEELARQRRWQEAHDLNVEANSYHEKRNFKKAVELYRKALAIDPNRPVISENLRKAEVLLQKEIDAENRRIEKKRQFREAENRVRGMLGNLSSDFDGSRGRASTLDEGSETTLDFIDSKEPLLLKEAEKPALPDFQVVEIERSLIVDPRVVKGQMTAAEAEEARRKEAERDLKAFASVTFAIASVSKGDYEAGIGHLKKALEIKPGDATIQKQLGYVYYLRDQEAIKRASNTKVKALLDALQVGRGDWKASLAHLRAVYREDPSQTGHRDAFFFLQGLSGYYGGSLKTLKEKAPSPIDNKTRQDLIETIVESARIIKEERDPAKAYAILEKAHNTYPEVRPVHDYLHYAEGLVAAKNTEEITRISDSEGLEATKKTEEITGIPVGFAATKDDSEALLGAVERLPEKSFKETVTEKLESLERSLADYWYNE